MALKKHWMDDDLVEVGLDEAGRGTLWGRMYIGAVILSPEDEAYSDNGVLLAQIKDSKKLTPRKRAVLADYIQDNAIETVVTWAEPDEIDSKNVLHADLAAMHRALDSLSTPFQRILVDGNVWNPYKETEAVVIPGGDAKCLAIAAASILAKEAHDAWVRSSIEEDPTLDEHYGFSSNMGYGTKTHMDGLKQWGAHALHRKSFRPVADVLGWMGS
jgi:ribonuclease HII